MGTQTAIKPNGKDVSQNESFVAHPFGCGADLQTVMSPFQKPYVELAVAG